MKWGRSLPLVAGLIMFCLSMSAPALEKLQASCAISASEHAGQFRLRIFGASCNDERDDHSGCGEFSDNSIDRLSGITIADLGREGAQITASLQAEPGTFTCAGTVHGEVLRGSSTFTPSEAFVERMNRMGFNGLDAKKLQAYTLFDIDSNWIESLKKAHIGGLTTDNLIALKIFHVDAAYVSSLTALGYETPDADKLVALKVQGVNPDEVRQVRAMGYKPSIDELVQMRIFHITPEFIRQMQGRGLHDLTIAKLVQIKIFKLDE